MQNQFVFSGPEKNRTGHVARILAMRMGLDMPQAAIHTAVKEDIMPYAQGFESEVNDAVVQVVRIKGAFTNRMSVLGEISDLFSLGCRMCFGATAHIAMMFPAYHWEELESGEEVKNYVHERKGFDFAIPGVMDRSLVASAVNSSGEKIGIWFSEIMPRGSISLHVRSYLPNIEMPAELAASM